ncbi:hypothetical protein C8Q76DRAFT_303831 [Earliella scabrosa]|nr:hypothetical protein C8Q76DRAFT_303831 [Earliella scabrosa]
MGHSIDTHARSVRGARGGGTTEVEQHCKYNLVCTQRGGRRSDLEAAPRRRLRGQYAHCRDNRKGCSREWVDSPLSCAYTFLPVCRSANTTQEVTKFRPLLCYLSSPTRRRARPPRPALQRWLCLLQTSASSWATPPSPAGSAHSSRESRPLTACSVILKERYLAWTVSVTASGLRRSKRPAAKKGTEWEGHTSRYVEVRLVYDRGTVTKFGLMKPGARIQSFLMGCSIRRGWSPWTRRAGWLLEVLRTPRALV